MTIQRLKMCMGADSQRGVAVTETLLCIVPFLAVCFLLIEFSFMWIDRHSYSLAAYETARVVSSSGWKHANPCHSQQAFVWANQTIRANSYWTRTDALYNCEYDPKKREVRVSLKAEYEPKVAFLEKLLAVTPYKFINVQATFKREFLGDAFTVKTGESSVSAKDWPGLVRGALKFVGQYREYGKRLSESVYNLGEHP